MKKQLLTVFAASLAFAACTNEDLIQQIEVPGVEGEMITLDEGFAIGVTRGDDATTRAQYDNLGNINWLPQVNEVSQGVYAPSINKVGLSWKGQAADGKVYTNYLFENFAVPVKDKKPVYDECVGWTNLVFYNKADYDEMGTTGENDYVTAWGWDATNLKTTITTASSKVADPSKAYFKTENLTIFGGDYVMYMPYDESFINAGYLYAKSPAVFDHMHVASKGETARLLQHVADYHFYVGADALKGGQTANGFTLNAVTGNVILKLMNKTKSGVVSGDLKEYDWTNIKKIAIYGKNGIVLEQAINATDLTLIKDSEATPVKTGTSLMANLSENFSFSPNASGDATYYVAMTALPQTIEDALIVLFDKDGKSCVYNAGAIKVERGQSTTVDVVLDKNNPLQTAIYYVVDMETFQMAMTQAAAASTAPNQKATIQLINDIVYDSEYTTSQGGVVYIDRDMDIQGGNITVPAGEKLVLKLINDEVNVTIDGKITIEDACCGVQAAVVEVAGIDSNGGNLLRPTGTNANKQSSILFKQEVSVENGAKLTIGTVDAYVKAEFQKSVTNNGTMNIVDDATVKFGVLNNNGALNLDNAASTNIIQATVATLNNAGAVTVGEHTTLVADNTVNDGSLEIEASGNETDGLDGTVNVQAAMVNNGVIENSGVYNSNGTTTLNAASQFVDYVGSQYGHNMPKMNGGDYICEVNTSVKINGDRLAYALNDKMKTTIVRFVTGSTHEYQLNDYDEYAKLAEVDFVINTTDATSVVFRNNLPATEGQIVLGGDLTVLNAASVTFNGNDTKIGGNLAVECAAAISNNGTNLAQVTVGGNVTLSKGATLTVQALKGATAANQLTAKSLTVGGNVILTNEANTKLTVEKNAAVDVEGDLTIAAKASAVFEYSSYSDFGGKIVNNGTFNRVLSSGSSNANPAMVWCKGYTNNGTQVNGAAQVSE